MPEEEVSEQAERELLPYEASYKDPEAWDPTYMPVVADGTAWRRGAYDDSPEPTVLDQLTEGAFEVVSLIFGWW